MIHVNRKVEINMTQSMQHRLVSIVASVFRLLKAGVGPIYFSIITSMLFVLPAYGQSSVVSMNVSSSWKGYKASPNNRIMQEEIKLLSDTKLVTVVIYQPLTTDPPVDEAALLEYGCKFPIDDQAKITTLTDIVRNSEIKAVQRSRGTITPITGIYFTLKNDKKFTIFLNEKHISEKTIEGRFNDFPVIVDEDIANKLYAWAAETGIQTSCDGFLKK